LGGRRCTQVVSAAKKGSRVAPCDVAGCGHSISKDSTPSSSSALLCVAKDMAKHRRKYALLEQSSQNQSAGASRPRSQRDRQHADVLDRFFSAKWVGGEEYFNAAEDVGRAFAFADLPLDTLVDLMDDTLGIEGFVDVHPDALRCVKLILIAAGPVLNGTSGGHLLLQKVGLRATECHGALRQNPWLVTQSRREMAETDLEAILDITTVDN
jgi:hypothetical protein